MQTLLIFTGIAFITTLAGSILPFYQEKWAHRHLWRFLAFSSGVLLGVTFLKVLPEAFFLGGKFAGAAVLATFTALFAAENVTMVHACEDFLNPPTTAVMPVSALVALALHAAVDGMAIGVGLRQNLALGSVISMGVILHKFSDGMTLTSVLRVSNYSRNKEKSLAVLLALATPLGAFASYLGSVPFSDLTTGLVLGIATGSFLYVGAADLLPRLHEAHDRYSLLYFVGGILIVVGML